MKKRGAACMIAALVSVSPASARERGRAAPLDVLASGALVGVMPAITQAFEQRTGRRVTVRFGASSGSAGAALPTLIAAGAQPDVLLIFAATLDRLERERVFATAMRVPIATSRIGVTVRQGAPHPAIASSAQLRAALLAAPTIGYSEGSSGVYVTTALIQRLGIAEQVRPRLRRISGELVGAAVARGDVAIGLQQESEIRAAPGADFVGPLPQELQQTSDVVAAIPVARRGDAGAARFVAFLRSAPVRRLLAAGGLPAPRRR